MFIEAKDDGSGDDNLSYKLSKAPVKSSPPKKNKFVIIYYVPYTIVGKREYYADQIVVAGQPVTIQCHAAGSQKVLWQYKHYAEENVRYIYDIDGRFINSYEQRAVVNETTNDLTLHAAQLSDTGEYWCVENEGFGTKHITQLYVTTGTAVLWLENCCHRFSLALLLKLSA